MIIHLLLSYYPENTSKPTVYADVYTVARVGLNTFGERVIEKKNGLQFNKWFDPYRNGRNRYPNLVPATNFNGLDN